MQDTINIKIEQKNPRLFDSLHSCRMGIADKNRTDLEITGFVRFFFCQ